MSTFLLRNDPIQVDRWLFRIRARLAKYKEENKQLHEQVMQLRNKPDSVYDPPKKRNLVVRGSAAKIDMSAPIAKWHTGHFIRYFQEKYNQKYPGQEFKVRGSQWKAYAIRIKQFRDCHEELKDNRTYKNMIAWLFDNVFNKRFVATIPLITSDSMLHQWKIGTSDQQTSPERFKQIAAAAPKTAKDKDINDIIGTF